MVQSIAYTRYYDKVYGCWLGKCIAGTIGAPSEGRKELFDYGYDPRSVENMLPNDDLDLQILWLEVMERKGLEFTTEDLADAFFNKCPYSPGEYAVFKKNYARGIRPPTSGVFNNSYYLNGNGCPIRSEIWACISPGSPELARHFAHQDGIMDHGGDSVEGEAFYAAMEAAAFFEDDIHNLLETGLSQVSSQGRTHEIVRRVMQLHGDGCDRTFTRESIINEYGHPDCTNYFQNLGFTVLSLLYGEGDFIESTMLGLNCGFDTDCTCATVGAIIGIMQGAEKIMAAYGFSDPGYVLGVEVQRRSNCIADLAEDTCRIGAAAAEQKNPAVKIMDAPSFDPLPHSDPPAPITLTVEYTGTPAIGIGESCQVKLSVQNTTDAGMEGLVRMDCPEGWLCNPAAVMLNLEAKQQYSVPITVSVPDDTERLDETNLLTASFSYGNEKTEYQFGLVGAAVWRLYGPFWDNCLELPTMDYWDSYYEHISGRNASERADKTRAYHLNTTVDIEKPYLPEPSLRSRHSLPSHKGHLVNTHTDRFSVNDLLGWQGPCVVYLERCLFSPEDRELGVLIGHTDAYKLWLNGDLISARSETDWCTDENRHVLRQPIRKGVNRVVVKLARRSAKADFSLIFCEEGPTSTHISDFSSFAVMTE